MAIFIHLHPPRPFIFNLKLNCTNVYFQKTLFQYELEEAHSIKSVQYAYNRDNANVCIFKTNFYFQEFGIRLGNPMFIFMIQMLVTDQSSYLSIFLILMFKRKKPEVIKLKL